VNIVLPLGPEIKVKCGVSRSVLTRDMFRVSSRAEYAMKAIAYSVGFGPVLGHHAYNTCKGVEAKFHVF
jgi:hypothetical protein